MRALWISFILGLSISVTNSAFAASPATQSWNLEQLPILQQAVAGTSFELHQLENALLIKVFAEDTFKSDRPELLLPSALSKVGKFARHIAGKQQLSVLVLGMSAEQSSPVKRQEISQARAKSLASIFRLSKLPAVRMQAFGVGASPQTGPELAASILIVPAQELPAFAAHFRETPVFLAYE